MDKRIVEFIAKQTCLTVCCIDEAGLPFCFNCFYGFDAKNALLIYKSSETAHHSLCLERNRNISGTILPDRVNKYSIQGIQFSGQMVNLDGNDIAHAKTRYYTNFPIAKTIKGSLYTIQIQSIKMSESVLGISRQIAWERRDLYTENSDGYFN